MSLKPAIQDIIARLETVTELKHVRVFNNQFEFMEQGVIQSFPFPCAFVEAVPQQFGQLGGGYQQSDVDFRIHIGHEQYDAGGGTFEQNYDVFDLRDLVYAALAGFKPTMCGELFKTVEGQDYSHTNIYKYTIEFRTGFIDKTASTLIDPTTIDPVTLDLDVYVIWPDAFNEDFNEDFAGENLEPNIYKRDLITM